MTEPAAIHELRQTQPHWASRARRRSAAKRPPPDAGEAIAAAAIALIEVAGRIQRERADVLRGLAAESGNEVLIQRLSKVADAIEVLAAFPDAPAQPPRQRMRRGPGPGNQAGALAQPLTEREETVLRFLSGTLSLREIGAALYVSQNTVKTHTRAIYRKLGASSRHGAIRRGRELGLLCT